MPAIEITTRVGCSNMCCYCPQNKFIIAYKKVSTIIEMGLNTFRRCLDKISESVDIQFSGLAEPRFNRDCTRMVLHAHNKGHKIQIFTTLAGMNTEDVETIKKINIELLNVHLPDGDGNTNIERSDQYVSVLQNIISSIPSAVYIYYDSNSPHIKPLLKTAKTTRLELATRANNVKIIEKKTKWISGPVKCTRALRQNVLLPSGDVVLCCNDYGLKHVLGNLIKSDYDSLFSGEGYKRILKGANDDPIDILCRYCKVFTEKTDVRKRGGRIARLLYNVLPFCANS